MSSLLQDGCEPRDLGIVGDDFGIVEAKVTEALGKNDMLLVGGGTSVGSKDIVPDVLDSLGEPGIVVHGLAMRPGKPAGLAILNKKPVVLLPGYPVAALITYSIIARPIIFRLLGSENIRNTGDIVKARLTRKIDSPPGIREFVRVVIRNKSPGFSAEPVTATGASILSSMVRSNGILVVPENIELFSELLRVSSALSAKPSTADLSYGGRSIFVTKFDARTLPTEDTIGTSTACILCTTP